MRTPRITTNLIEEVGERALVMQHAKHIVPRDPYCRASHLAEPVRTAMCRFRTPASRQKTPATSSVTVASFPFLKMTVSFALRLCR